MIHNRKIKIIMESENKFSDNLFLNEYVNILVDVFVYKFLVSKTLLKYQHIIRIELINHGYLDIKGYGH